MNTTAPPTAAHRLPRWIWVLGILCVLAMVWGLWSALRNRQHQQQALEQSTQQTAAALAIAASEWMPVSEQVLQLGVRITGNLVALEHARIKARTAGELKELHLREGDSVRAGQIIARVDATEPAARVRQAQQQADAAKAQVAIQQRQHDNNRALVDKGFISSTALATSAANLQAAQAQWAAARAAQDGAQKSLDDTVLRSPIAGQVAARLAQNGEQVMPEAPIVEIVNLSALELQAMVPANDSAHIQIGQSAQLHLASEPGQAAAVWDAKVVRINPTALEGSRSVLVYLQLATLSHPNGAQLRPGMYVEGHIQTTQRQVLAVPLSAVRTDKPAPYVQRAKDGVIEHTTVQLGVQALHEGQTWVQVQGLQAGDAVLLGNVGGIPSGTLVTLQPAAAADAAKVATAAT